MFSFLFVFQIVLSSSNVRVFSSFLRRILGDKKFKYVRVKKKITEPPPEVSEKIEDVEYASLISFDCVSSQNVNWTRPFRQWTTGLFQVSCAESQRVFD